MIPIPVIADKSVVERPIAAKAHKHVFAMVVRVKIPEHVPGTLIVAENEPVIWCDLPGAYPA